jgi:hypothetical protein
VEHMFVRGITLQIHVMALAVTNMQSVRAKNNCRECVCEHIENLWAVHENISYSVYHLQISSFDIFTFTQSHLKERWPTAVSPRLEQLCVAVQLVYYNVHLPDLR